MFNKILIANRGEIAVRIIRACKEMGIVSVAVFSQEDRSALHVSLADESYCIGMAKSGDSYLNMMSIISVALASKCETIHPGYGFLSENEDFARLCTENNIVFIGAPYEVISKMGDKEMAKRTMKEANVPVIMGSEIVSTIDDARREAAKIGFPLLIKARSGGGGRGIRLISCDNELEKNYHSAASEAACAFGDSALYLEKFLTNVKHIETQILADNFGNVVCLGERDCSMQRKNQKFLEESPAQTISEQTRQKLINTAINAAKAVNYKGAGTIEFLCDRDENFYFMEMNTRLQVEHPVSEMVTGIDIVKWQIRIAAGMSINFAQSEIELSGHAIECRINSENPYQNFRPSFGKIELLHIPGGPWVRFDTAIYQGYEIPPYYDSMIGKLIVYAKTRDEAIRKMKSALCELIIEGIEHNADFQSDILSSEEFESANYTIDFLSKWEK